MLRGKSQFSIITMHRFGEDVMNTMLRFTLAQIKAAFGDAVAEVSVLDIGTGNGVLPLELASLGLCKLAGAPS